jgi:hypothetical protein
MREQRVIVLVPTAQDMENETYLTKYWPNFVCHVHDVLSNANVDAKIVVATEWPVKRGGK